MQLSIMIIVIIQSLCNELIPRIKVTSNTNVEMMFDLLINGLYYFKTNNHILDIILIHELIEIEL